jgi:hypothetical protein
MSKETTLILSGIVLGVVIGFWLAICVVDDKERFTIPGTDKVFVRESSQ